MTNIKFNLFTLKRQLEIVKGRSYTWQEIAHDSGLHVNTLINISGNKTERVDLATLSALLTFFAAHGMPVTVGDLFTVAE